MMPLSGAPRPAAVKPASKVKNIEPSLQTLHHIKLIQRCSYLPIRGPQKVVLHSHSGGSSFPEPGESASCIATGNSPCHHHDSAGDLLRQASQTNGVINTSALVLGSLFTLLGVAPMPTAMPNSSIEKTIQPTLQPRSHILSTSVLDAVLGGSGGGDGPPLPPSGSGGGGDEEPQPLGWLQQTSPWWLAAAIAGGAAFFDMQLKVTETQLVWSKQVALALLRLPSFPLTFSQQRVNAAWEGQVHAQALFSASSATAPATWKSSISLRNKDHQGWQQRLWQAGPMGFLLVSNSMPKEWTSLADAAASRCDALPHQPKLTEAYMPHGGKQPEAAAGANDRTQAAAGCASPTVWQRSGSMVAGHARQPPDVHQLSSCVAQAALSSTPFHVAEIRVQTELAKAHTAPMQAALQVPGAHYAPAASPCTPISSLLTSSSTLEPTSAAMAQLTASACQPAVVQVSLGSQPRRLLMRSRSCWVPSLCNVRQHDGQDHAGLHALHQAPDPGMRTVQRSVQHPAGQQAHHALAAIDTALGVAISSSIGDSSMDMNKRVYLVGSSSSRRLLHNGPQMQQLHACAQGCTRWPSPGRVTRRAFVTQPALPHFAAPSLAPELHLAEAICHRLKACEHTGHAALALSIVAVK